MFAANACYLIPLLTVASIGVLLSTATRNSAAAVVGTIGVVILLFIVAQIPGLEGIRPYLLTEQFENWHGLLRTPTDWAPIAHSAWVCALYAVPALFAAYLVFLAATSPAASASGRLGRPQPPRPGSSTTDSSTSPISRLASRGSISPAPRRPVDSAPQATPKRRHWSGARPS